MRCWPESPHYGFALLDFLRGPLRIPEVKADGNPHLAYENTCDLTEQEPEEEMDKQ